MNIDNWSLKIMDEAKKDDNDIPEELADALKRAEENLKGWQRAVADFENYKRRDEQLHTELVALGQSQVLQTFLHIVHDLERILARTPKKLEDLAHFNKGLISVNSNLQKALKALGLEKVKTSGEKFNPEEHEAVMTVEGDKEGFIAEEIAPGYKRNGKLLTPAKVKVYKKPQASTPNDQ